MTDHREDVATDNCDEAIKIVCEEIDIISATAMTLVKVVFLFAFRVILYNFNGQ